MAIITPEYAQEMVRQHQSNKNWGGSTNKYASADILGQITTRPYVRSVLDYGCGKGELTLYLRAQGCNLPVYEYDPGIPGKDTPPKPGERFGIVITCDVLEHVEPEFTDETLRRLWGHTESVMYNNIACCSDLHVFQGGPYAGLDRHLVQRPGPWWLDKFDEAIDDPKCSLMEYRSVQRRHKTGVRERCVLIHERIG